MEEQTPDSGKPETSKSPLSINKDVVVKTALGVAGGAATVTAVMPAIHGLAGIAVAGLGIFAAGTAIFKTAEALMNQPGYDRETDRSMSQQPSSPQPPASHEFDPGSPLD